MWYLSRRYRAGGAERATQSAPTCRQGHADGADVPDAG
jgi:hypothetical protein